MMTAEGGLMENPWSWTQVANLVALEAPVGVGYSYCEAQAKGKKCKNTDKNTAKASRAALQHFFQKFPELSSSDFFITGESYGGVYIPTLAKEILDRAPEIRLKGLAVGDPCTDNAAQADSMDSLWCVWHTCCYPLLPGFRPSNILLRCVCSIRRARHPPSHSCCGNHIFSLSF
jgi:cathepsin A (carboxypeptidase C)